LKKLNMQKKLGTELEKQVLKKIKKKKELRKNRDSTCSHLISRCLKHR